ncbi:MAG TPA: UDP-N-acetylmuramate--L-alanine ligase [Chitinophagaceae bacterium]|nr:UDP-N-acetylmuramate--L-alanine ligase [Chitinophagaceae bacterium]
MPELKKINEISQLYFLGIGGIGMSALARYFHFHGKKVSGYDRTETALTRQLEEEGIEVHYEDNPALIPADTELVIYTPAIPASLQELAWIKQQGWTMMKRSEALGLITESSFTIAVAGTHGKTTISTMIAHLLRHSGFGCNAFLGGISVNYNSNFWSNERNLSVVEADEYDRSFLKLSPDMAVITSMDADHLDIYGSTESVEQAFIDFAGRLKADGTLLVKKGLKREGELKAERKYTYSLEDPSADIRPVEIDTANAVYTFKVSVRGKIWGPFVLPMGGIHNVENMTAAIGIASQLGIEEEKLKDAVSSFRGVKRRFEYIIREERVVMIDDYAHHPEELKALIGSARKLYPQSFCTLVFQPHLFSRTKDLAAAFAESLDEADEVLLLPIYPARELPVPGVSSKLIADKMFRAKVKEVSKEELPSLLARDVQTKKLHLIITAGAGDIDRLVDPVKQSIQNSLQA